MNALLKKLNFKNEEQIIILHAPDELKETFKEFEKETNVVHQIESSEAQSVAFLLVFVKSEEEVRQASERINGKLREDAVLWFAYPKKSSKKYKATISRDSGWQPLGQLGFEPVRQVAIDDDWSALRFRQVQHIKNMTRNPKMVLSEEGRDRLS